MLDYANQKGGRYYVALLFSLGVLQIAGFWFAGATVNGPGPLAIPQPDTPLYLQSARRVAEGFPFSFSPGSAVSTGSTTILYPFLFSVPFLLGVGADAAIACSFFLNALFYLVFLLGWGVAIRRWVSDGAARLLAVVLLGLFGQAAYSALALSDIGLWMALSGLFVAGLATGRRALYGTMLVLGPWVRPEGMVVGLAFALTVGGRMVFRRKRRLDADVLLSVLGIVSAMGVFALNYALTGAAQFASVATKGHFATRPFAAALYCSAADLLKMLSALLVGMADDFPRQLYGIPILGAVMIWVGAMTHTWNDWRKLVFPLAAAGGVWTVATSGWQSTNVDRYLAWIMPLLVVFSAEGFVWLYRRLGACRYAIAILIVPVVFAAGASVVFWTLFHSASEKSDTLMKFGRELQAVLPERATVGLTGNCGLAYPLAGHGIRTLYGIYSPEFEGPDVAYALEKLKNHPETRFDYWLFAEDDTFASGLEKLQGEPLLVGPDGLTVRKADWSAFDRAAAAPSELVGGCALKQRVDVGFPPDERLAGYETETRFGLAPLRVFQHVADLNGAKAYESGRVVWGLDSMFVALEPGKDVWIVLRTLREKDAAVPDALGGSRVRHFDFGSAPRLNVSVDGQVCATATVNIPNDGFADVVIRLPGTAITQAVSRIAFLGDHIACCYWFYQ